MNKIKNYKPITPSLRHRVIEDRSNLNKLLREKKLSIYLKKTGGRNNTGRITCRHRGGGHKRMLRYINYDYNKYNKNLNNSLLLSYEYDPNRTGLISKCYSPIFKPFYILSPDSNNYGKLSNIIKRDKLINIQPGHYIYNFNKFCRSAGTYGKLLKHDDNYSYIRLPSKKIIKLNNSNYASIGKSSNSIHKLIKKGKAGVNRWLGKRPVVRGYAQNPCDHPHGGKTSGGFQPKTKWGKYAKWIKKKW